MTQGVFWPVLGLSLIVVFNRPLAAQTPVQERLPDSCLVDFYPLNIGDTWQYQLMGPVETLITRKVIGDTLFDGKSYRVIEGFAEFYNEYFYAFQRYDSSTVYLYDAIPAREHILYRLDEDVGEYWHTTVPGLCDTTQLGRLDYIRENDIFGETRIEVSISYFCSRDTGYWISDEIVKGIGAVERGGEGDHEVLQGAIINGKQYGVIVSVSQRESASTGDTEHLSSYPNPFNATTNIRYIIETAGEIGITVHNLRGRPVNVLFKGYRTPGEYFITWDGTDSSGKSVASGTYVVFVGGDRSSKSRLATLLK